MKRILEKIYDAYLEEIGSSVQMENERVSETLQQRVMNLFKQPVREAVEKENKNIEVGNLYVMFMGDVPVHYVIYEEVDENLFEVLKMTTYYELASNIDLITKVDDELFAVETWNFFYLTSAEVANSIYYGKVNEEDYSLIKDLREGKTKELPAHKRGLTPISEKSVQSKFRQKEAEIVRELAFRLLMDLPED